MKNVCTLILLLTASWLYPQRTPKIKGNRTVAEVQEDLPAFNAIELDADLEIELVKAQTEGYGVTADDNLLDVLKFKVQDSTLLITSYYKITAKKKLEISIYYDHLERIIQKQGVLVTSGTLVSDKLSITVMENADMQLQARAPVVTLIMEGNGKGDFNMETDSLNVQLKDRIDARVYMVGETTTVEMSNDAKLFFEGSVATAQLQLKDKTDLKAGKLEAGHIVATLSGSGSAEVRPMEHLELAASGASRTYVYGTPKISLPEFSDTAVLHKRKD